VKHALSVVHALKAKKYVAHGLNVQKAAASNAARVRMETIVVHAQSALKA
jgi:hypothetical protein